MMTEFERGYNAGLEYAKFESDLQFQYQEWAAGQERDWNSYDDKIEKARTNIEEQLAKKKLELLAPVTNLASSNPIGASMKWYEYLASGEFWYVVTFFAMILIALCHLAISELTK